MFKGLSLSAKLYLGFGAVLLISGALGLYAYVKLSTIKVLEHQITKECMPAVHQAGVIGTLAGTNNTLVLEHILAETKPEKDAIEAKIKDLKGKIDAAMDTYDKTITNEVDRKKLEAVKSARAEFVRVRNEAVLPLSRELKAKEAEAARKGQLEPAFAKLHEAIESFVAVNNENGEAAGSKIASAVGESKSGIVIGLLAALFSGAAIGIFMSRAISNSLRKVIATLTEGSEQVSSASTQVSQSSQQMAEGASQQASSLEETSASLEELSSMTKQNSDNARQANAMAGDTRQAVEKSREAMTRMSTAIGQIKISSDQTAKIVKTIDEIAFQTNLLALNAAVEAARAGDAG
ncbi:MAG: MCP four helix bundle domain-containing protein, partial [Fibrobacteria bacterium]